MKHYKGFEVANEKKKSVPQMVKGRYQVRLNIGKSLKIIKKVAESDHDFLVKK